MTEATKVSFDVNGTNRTLELDTRTSLLDALREHLNLTGTNDVSLYTDVLAYKNGNCNSEFSIHLAF